ncbi:MAG: hypothetical protein LBM92_02770 [Opitutaceae bacterium]|jgi:hypothetical protein|nr:hypothetical protein [Opitutaceae bacterium]
MKKTNTKAFIAPTMIYWLMLFSLLGAGGVGKVWYQQRIADVANSIKQAEQQLAEIERKLAGVTAAAAAEHTPDALNRRNRQWALGLAQVSESQIVRVGESPERRLAAKRNAELLAGDGGLYLDLNRNNSRPAANPAPQPARYALGGAH